MAMAIFECCNNQTSSEDNKCEMPVTSLSKSSIESAGSTISRQGVEMRENFVSDSCSSKSCTISRVEDSSDQCCNKSDIKSGKQSPTSPSRNGSREPARNTEGMLLPIESTSAPNKGLKDVYMECTANTSGLSSENRKLPSCLHTTKPQENGRSFFELILKLGWYETVSFQSFIVNAHACEKP